MMNSICWKMKDGRGGGKCHAGAMHPWWVDRAAMSTAVQNVADATKGFWHTIWWPKRYKDEMEATTIALLVLMPLLVWRIYARLKRAMGRSRSQLWRHWCAAVLLPLAVLGLALAASSDMLAASCLGAGALAGAWLGVWGIKLTRFEHTDKGWFFTPNLHLGLVVTMLFIARLLYRGLELYVNSRALAPAQLQDFSQSPLTLLSFGLLAGYYCSYGAGLVRWRSKA
jgi:hypothetical protein